MSLLKFICVELKKAAKVPSFLGHLVVNELNTISLRPWCFPMDGAEEAELAVIIGVAE